VRAVYADRAIAIAIGAAVGGNQAGARSRREDRIRALPGAPRWKIRVVASTRGEIASPAGVQAGCRSGAGGRKTFHPRAPRDRICRSGAALLAPEEKVRVSLSRISDVRKSRPDGRSPTRRGLPGSPKKDAVGNR
jgi:hypothetical protein